MLQIRRAEMKDLDAIMKIIEDGIATLWELGSPQWQNGYGPTIGSVRENIDKQEGYVLLSNKVLVGTACLQSGIDPVYTAIEEGEWEDHEGAYLSIHRFCIDSSYSGKQLGTQFLHLLVMQAVELGYHDIRIDTYPENYAMQKVITHCGFSRKGIVYFPIPSGERIAFQKIIKNLI